MRHLSERLSVRYSFLSIASIFLLSASIICLQLTLMRMFSLTRSYHFSYLVISTALLGFGASGTYLALGYRRIENRLATWSVVLFLLYTLSIPICLAAAQKIPIDVQHVFYSPAQLARLFLQSALVFVPFFIGALLIGLALIAFRDHATVVYGANLLGSGVGGMARGFLFPFPLSSFGRGGRGMGGEERRVRT